ncbi:hypothetical protein F4809DRAFT_30357 [Biscogniauxia mediterranea]|nr:hypothetical protein F4809DRAFT_30357 [Biscogniauxia mediterranea]
MQITGLLSSFILATAVLAKGDKNSTGTSVKSQCRTIAKMTSLVDLANNQTKLESKTDGNQTKIDEIKAKAANSTAMLSTLTANSTLMGECAVIAAHDEAVQACGAIQQMEKATALASNDTKLQSKFDGNTTKIDEFKSKVSSMATMLATLQSNATLSSFCAVQADIESCKDISRLQKTIALASNDTALTDKFKGNTTKADNFKSKVADDQAKLDAMTSNTTLMATCNSLSQAGTTQGSASSTDSSSSSTGSSPAIRLEAAGNFATAAFVVIMGAVLML